VLGDFSTYPAWNPLTPAVEGEPQAGEIVHLTVRLGGSTMKRVHRVSRADGTALCWTIESAAPWFLRGERCQTLRATETGCRYENDERVEGLVSPIVELFYAAKVRAALEDVGRSLRDHLVASPR